MNYNTLYLSVFQAGFGMINLGRHLGLFYAPKDEVKNCPRSWLFVASEDVQSAEELEKIVNGYKEHYAYQLRASRKIKNPLSYKGLERCVFPISVIGFFFSDYLIGILYSFKYIFTVFVSFNPTFLQRNNKQRVIPLLWKEMSQ